LINGIKMSKLTDDYLKCLHEGNAWLNTKAAGYAAYKTAGTLSKPFRKVGGWAAKKASRGIKKGMSTAGNSMANSIKNRFNQMRRKSKTKRNMKKFKKNIARNKKLAAKENKV